LMAMTPPASDDGPVRNFTLRMPCWRRPYPGMQRFFQKVVRQPVASESAAVMPALRGEIPLFSVKNSPQFSFHRSDIDVTSRAP
jgi:hypothetical protein